MHQWEHLIPLYHYHRQRSDSLRGRGYRQLPREQRYCAADRRPDALERPQEEAQNRAAAARAAKARELADSVFHLRHRAASLFQASHSASRLT